MGKDYGQPLRYDPDFQGPIHNRSCTDILWLIIFVIFLGGYGYVGYYSISHGDVERLLAPIDTKGRRCGLDSDVSDKKYLVFFDIAKCLSPEVPIVGCSTPQVCVEKCPETTVLLSTQLAANPSAFESLRSSFVCTDDVNISTMTYSQAVQYMEAQKCANYVLKSESVIGRCFPNVTEMVEVLSDVFNQTGVSVEQVLEQMVNLVQLNQLSSQIVEDLVQSRWYMVGALVAVIFLCMIYIVLLRWIVAPVVWTSILGLLALLGFCVAPIPAVYLCYKNYKYYLEHPVTLMATSNALGYTKSLFTKHEVWLGLMILVAVVLVILFLIVIFLRKRIVIATALIGEGSKAVSAVKSTMAFPIFPWIIQCFVIAYGVVVLMYILSIGDSTFKVVNLANDTTCNCNGRYTTDYEACDPLLFSTSCHDSSSSLLSGLTSPCQQASCHFVGLDNPNSVFVLHIVNIVGFFWLMFFISGISDMILAGTFATWYWTFKKSKLPFWTLTGAIYRTFRYNMGTVALGALIITIVRVIRVALEYIDHKLKKFDNPFTRCILCCCKCFFYCLESFLKFINKNAYIVCAIHGTSFCHSAREAFSLLMRNIVRVVVLDKVTDFIFFLSKLLISIGVGIGVYYLLQWNYVYEVTQGTKLHHNYVPAIILTIATYLVTSIFFSVYAMAVDTLFLCFLEDCERNDGSPEKPYFMSKNLMKILGKRNKIA